MILLIWFYINSIFYNKKRALVLKFAKYEKTIEDFENFRIM